MPNIQNIKVKHKVARSFAAMFRGWVACNAMLLTCVLCMDKTEFSGSDFFITFYLILCTAIVIFIAWLLVFLPADLIVPEDSILREPLLAALCGAMAYPLLYLLFAIGVSVYEGRIDTWAVERGLPLIGMLGLFLLPMVTGLTAALTLVRRYPRQRKTL
jgi:hypothetical protein